MKFVFAHWQPQPMKLATMFFFVLMLVQSGAKGQSVGEPDWKWQNPLPTNHHLYDVQFLSSQTAVAAGLSGTLLKTSNGGQSWTHQISGTRNHLVSIFFISSQNGWVVGDSGTILHTSNGGQNWNQQSSGTKTYLGSVYFLNAQTGWAAGDSGTIRKTIDGGQSWTVSSISFSIMIQSVFFVDSQTGWLVGQSGEIMKTTNGGQNWFYQQSNTDGKLSSVQFVNSVTGWIAGAGGKILKTNNGGQTWIQQNSETIEDLSSVSFINTETGMAVGSNGTVLKTTNGGQTWVSLSTQTLDEFSSVHFFNFNACLLVGGNYGASIFKSTNGGQTWISQTKGEKKSLISVHFIDTKSGWAVGYGGTILNTTNGGQIWNSQVSGSYMNLSSVFFIDDQTGWAVGSGYTILKTINGGQSWFSQANPAPGSLYSVYFIDLLTGWVVGSNGNIIKTTDGGQNWIDQNSGTNLTLTSVYFVDSQTGFVAGKGIIKRTTNGGQSWNQQYNNTTVTLTAIFFIDSQMGWAVGTGGTILKTSNGGQNWQIQSNGSNKYLYAVYFIDTQTGWVAGESGGIWKTSDGGITWVHQNSGTSYGIGSLQFKGSFGWAVGNYGAILTTINNTPISTETLSSLVTGNLFEKAPSGCIQTATPVPGLLVKATPGPYYGISDQLGKFNLQLPLADSVNIFTLHALENQNPGFQQLVLCPPGNLYTLTLDTIPDTLYGKDFGLDVTPCHHLNVQVSSSRRRRCFRNMTAILYSNDGYLAATGGYILVEFPHWVRPLSASRSHIALNDSVWRFNLDSVSAGESGSFTITDSVLCGHPEILGLSQCTKATIYPAPDCPPPSGYNGAEVTVSGKCHNGDVSLGIYNRGIADMADSVDYWVYLDSIQVKQAKVKLAAGDSIKLWVNAQGFSVHLTVNQVANHPFEVFVSTTVDDCSDTTVFYPRPIVNHFPKQQTANSKIHCLEIRASYDPNDKTVVPRGFTNQNIISPNTELEYLVRFQNTGNDTAFTVYVIDTLDQNLNVESLELGASSHPYQISLQTTKSGKTFIRWQFDNILLPDSNTNELRSHGFIQYRISPKPGLALGSKVRNHAEIYFDFNPPVITNHTLTTFDNVTYTDPGLNNNVQMVTALPGKLSPKQIGVNLFPNPVTEHSLTADFSTKGNLVLFNAQGQQVFEKQNIEGKQVLPIHLKSGFYVAHLKTEKGVSVVKVVVE